MLFMGIDVGTQGVRCSVIDETGAPEAIRSAPFGRLSCAENPAYREQDPADWAAALDLALSLCMADLAGRGHAADEIEAISIDGTSGTIVPLDAENRPLGNAIMYNDPRAKAEAALVHAAMGAHERKLGLTFGASFSLPRILWIQRHCPAIYEKTALFAHQADYVAGLLCGIFNVSDYSNALKTGYDLIDHRWPGEIGALDVDSQRLPKIVRPGAAIARVSAGAARQFGLSERTVITGGSTDGYASALAAGAVKPGDWASIIGTTVVLKGVTQELVVDPTGSAYSHRLPGGAWLLGGASNVGGRCLNALADKADFAALDRLAEAQVPTGARCYPLTGRGERFPFVSDTAEAFYAGDILGGKLYPALMEGVGLMERFAYERMAAIGCAVGDTICATGGASRSDLWLRIRASILQKALVVPQYVDASVGSALLAASAHFGSLEGAAARMIRYEKTVEPVAAWASVYDEVYGKFRDEVRRMYGV